MWINRNIRIVLVCRQANSSICLLHLSTASSIVALCCCFNPPWLWLISPWPVVMQGATISGRFVFTKQTTLRIDIRPLDWYWESDPRKKKNWTKFLYCTVYTVCGHFNFHECQELFRTTCWSKVNYGTIELLLGNEYTSRCQTFTRDRLWTDSACTFSGYR